VQRCFVYAAPGTGSKHRSGTPWSAVIMPWNALAGDPLRGGLDDPPNVPSALYRGPYRLAAPFFDHDDVESGLGAGRSIISGAVGQPLIRTPSSSSERPVGAPDWTGPAACAVLRLRYEQRLDGCFRSVQVRPGWRILAGQPRPRSNGRFTAATRAWRPQS
jgi:hypothetical protein